MEAALLMVIAALCLTLSALTERALDKKLKVEPCTHEVTVTSWSIGTTRCLECGEVLDDGAGDP